MPRTSAAALSVVHFEPAERRPEPPVSLSPEAAAEWRMYVNGMPPDWFPVETHPMLSQLCKLVVRGKGVAQNLDRMQRSGKDLNSPKEYRDLVRLEMQISNSISNLSTKMRLTQQSSAVHGQHKSKRNAKKDIPWENEEASNDDTSAE